MSKHSRPILYRHKHEEPLFDVIAHRLMAIPVAWWYLAAYCMAALSGVLIGIIINMIASI